jgi:hypothetical protein
VVRVIPNKAAIQRMDRSEQDLVGFTRTPGEKLPWSRPRDLEQVLVAKAAAQRPCNHEALQFWGLLLLDANQTPAAVRSATQVAISSANMPRPLWAAYRAPKSQQQKHKERERRANNQGGLATEENANVPAEPEGTEEGELRDEEAPQGGVEENPGTPNSERM